MLALGLGWPCQHGRVQTGVLTVCWWMPWKRLMFEHLSFVRAKDEGLTCYYIYILVLRISNYNNGSVRPLKILLWAGVALAFERCAQCTQLDEKSPCKNLRMRTNEKKWMTHYRSTRFINDSGTFYFHNTWVPSVVIHVVCYWRCVESESCFSVNAICFAPIVVHTATLLCIIYVYNKFALTWPLLGEWLAKMCFAQQR